MEGTSSLTTNRGLPANIANYRSCAAIASLLATAVIFGALAGVALWKGGFASLKNPTFCYLGYGAVGAGAMALSAAVVLAIYQKCARQQAKKIIFPQPHSRAASPPVVIAAAAPLPPQPQMELKKFGGYTVEAIKKKFKCWEPCNIEKQFAKEPKFLKAVTMYIVYTNYTLHNWGISPENLPTGLTYSPAFIEKYLGSRVNNKNTLTNMPEQVRTQFIQHIITNNPTRSGVIHLDNWPADTPFTKEFLESEVQVLKDSRNFSMEFRSYGTLTLRKALLDHLVNTNRSRSIYEGDLLADSEYDNYNDNFMNGYLTTHTSLDSVRDPLLREKFIHYIIAHKPALSHLISPDQWPAELPFTADFLNGQLNKERYNPFILKDQSEPFKTALIQHIITQRHDQAHLIEPSDLPTLDRINDRFLIAYLSKISSANWRQIPDQMRSQLIPFSIDNDLTAVCHIRISEWPEGKRFTDKFLKHQLKQRNFNLLDKPAAFKTAMIEYIIEKKELQHVGLIAAADLPNKDYSLAFMDSYLPLPTSDFSALPEAIRPQFINYVLQTAPQFAGRIDTSWLESAPSFTFIEYSLGANLQPRLEAMRPEVKVAFENHMAKEPSVIVDEFMKTVPNAKAIAELIGGSRQVIADELLKRLTAELITAIRKAHQSHLIASRLPKDPHYLPTDDLLKPLWRGNYDSFAIWAKDRYQQMALLDYFYEGLGSESKRQAHFKTLKLFGLRFLNACTTETRDNGETPYRRAVKAAYPEMTEGLVPKLYYDCHGHEPSPFA